MDGWMGGWMGKWIGGWTMDDWIDRRINSGGKLME